MSGEKKGGAYRLALVSSGLDYKMGVRGVGAYGHIRKTSYIQGFRGPQMELVFRRISQVMPMDTYMVSEI